MEGEMGNLKSMWVSGYEKLNVMKVLSSRTKKSEAGPLCQQEYGENQLSVLPLPIDFVAMEMAS